MVGLKKRNVWRNSIIIVIVGFVFLVLGPWLVDATENGFWLNATYVLALLCFAFAFIIGMSALSSGSSRHAQPDTPDRSILARVLEYEATGEEMFLYGTHEDTPRSILKQDWPFSADLKDEKWIICDAHVNDLSDSPLSSFEGTVYIRFPEQELSTEY